MMNRYFLFRIFFTVIILSCILIFPLNGQNARVEIHANVTRSIGGVTELDRTKYFRIHTMDEDEDHMEFYNKYNVGFPGRTFNGPGEIALSLTGEVGNYNIAATLNEHVDWTAKDSWKLNISDKVAHNSSNWQKAIWVKKLNGAIYDSIIVKAKILLHGTFASNSTIFYLGLNSTADMEGGEGNIAYLSKITNLTMRSDNNTPLDKSVMFDQADAAGDTLEVQVKFNINSDAGSSKVSTRLINLVDGDTTNWGSYHGIKQEVFDAVTNGNAYFKMSTGEMIMAGITQLDIIEVNIEELAADFSGLGELDNVLPVKRYVRCSKPEHSFKEGLNMDDVTNFTTRFFKSFLDKSYIPEFFEPMNEPFVHARDFYDEPDWTDYAETRVKLQMAKYHIAVARGIHQSPALANIKVAGYTAAWPEFDRNDFSVWRENMKMFMDTAGLHMDAFSTHIYDGINVVGQEARRSGSNMIAVLDMIESYSYLKWGIVKPHVISEYGATTNDEEFRSTYTDVKNAQAIRSQNSIIFELFEREDRLGLSIPFTVGKAEWHITEANNYEPYTSILFKPFPMHVPKDQITGWEYTPRIYFFDLWKEVQGKRINIKSDNPDVLVQAFLNDNEIFVALNNLEENSQTVDLKMIGQLPNLTDVLRKSLIIYDDKLPSFTSQTLSEAPSSISLENSETVVLKYVFNENVSQKSHLSSFYYYSAKVLEPIEAGRAISYTFENVDNGIGYVTLKMSIGRAHNLSKSPVVAVNGTEVIVPSNWKGYDQAPRQVFFGTIEIPVPSKLIQENNTISFSFPDDGGYISSVMLNVEKLDSLSESVALMDIPDLMVSDNSISFEVNYLGSQNRDILIYLKDFHGDALVQKRISVDAGIGTKNIHLDLDAVLVADEEYQLVANLLPVGSDIKDKIASDSATINVSLPHTVTIVVLDDEDNLPVGNATVQFNDSIKFTDNSGIVTFYNVSPMETTLSVNKESFEPYGPVTLKILNDTTITYLLTPVSYSVKLTLRDSSGSSYINNAKVILDQEEQTSQVNGTVYFSIKKGTYPLTVTHEYYSLGDSITITADLDSILTLPKIYTDWLVHVKKDDEPLTNTDITVGDETQKTNTFGKATFYHLKIDSAYTVSITKDTEVLFEDTVIIMDNEIYTINIETTSIQNQSLENQIGIYPNPVKEQLTLELPDITGHLLIVSIVGVVLATDQFQGEPVKTINVSHLEPGFYILKFSFMDQIIEMKFIKR